LLISLGYVFARREQNFFIGIPDKTKETTMHMQARRGENTHRSRKTIPLLCLPSSPQQQSKQKTTYKPNE
jgi:hypothetical protein